MIFVRENYPNLQNDKSCPLCSTEVNKFSDSQEHLLQCMGLNSGSTDLIEKDSSYDDIFSENQSKQAKITLLLETKYNQEKIIGTVPVSRCTAHVLVCFFTPSTCL